MLLSLYLLNIVASSKEASPVNPCISSKCEKISTQLMSRHQYTVILRKYKTGDTQDHKDTQDDSWIRFLRKRRRKKLQQQRERRIKRSPTRTVVSVNSEYKSFKKNKKCHKYAMFKVSKHHHDLLSQQALIRCPVAKILFIYSMSLQNKGFICNWTHVWLLTDYRTASLREDLHIIYKDMPRLSWDQGAYVNVVGRWGTNTHSNCLLKYKYSA